MDGLSKARIEAWQSYRQAYAQKGWKKAVERADEEIRRIKANEADWRRRVFGGPR